MPVVYAHEALLSRNQHHRGSAASFSYFRNQLF